MLNLMLLLTLFNLFLHGIRVWLGSILCLRLLHVLWVLNSPSNVLFEMSIISYHHFA